MLHQPQDERKPEISPLVPLDREHRCPTCGKPWQPFSLRASGVLDTLRLAKDVISDALALVENEVMP